MQSNKSPPASSLLSAGPVIAMMLLGLIGCGGGSPPPSPSQPVAVPVWPPLTITVPPAKTSVAPGASAAFSIVVSGKPGYSYQWTYNGMQIHGGKQATYVLNNVQPSDSGAVIRVEVRDGSGASVTSDAVTLEVTGAGLRPFVGAVPHWSSVSPVYGTLPLDGYQIRGEGDGDGYGQEARFYNPRLLATDGAGNLYAADSMNYNVRKITPDGQVSTIAGIARGIPGDTDGSGAAASFGYLSDIAVTRDGTVYVQDVTLGTSVHKIRKITATGMVSTVTLPRDPLNFNEHGPAGEEQLVGIATDASENLYFAIEADMREPCPPEHKAEYPNCTLVNQKRFTIRKMGPSGLVNTVVSSESIYRDLKINPSWTYERKSTFQVDTDGTLYLATATDSGFDSPVAILAVSPAGITRKHSGSLVSTGYADGDADTARFRAAYDLTIDPAHNLFVLDPNPNQPQRSIRKIAPNGRVTTIAGDGPYGGISYGPLPGSLLWVSGLAIGKDGSFYVGATYGIIKVIPGPH